MSGKIILLLLAACASLSAHVVSMSSGFATVEGNRVEYILRMPDYEIAGVSNPERALFDHIRFSSGLESGRRTGEECHLDAAEATYVCAANYWFSAPVDRLGVECTFYEITVANHIHLLRAERAGKFDRAILDSIISSATLAFRPPTAIENTVEQMTAGGRRIFTGPIQILLLIALAFAGRNRREWLTGAVVFLAAESAAAVLASRIFWQPNPRFTEAAVSLALAYLGFEMIFFPSSGGRWLFAVLFGAFAGFYFSTFLAQSGYSPAYVLSGASAASCLVILLGGTAARYVTRFKLQTFSASAFLAAGCIWFAVRLRG